MSVLPIVLFGMVLAPAPDSTLSCDAFRARLETTIAGMGSLVAPPGAMVLAYDAEVGARYDWNGTAGLTGSMTCSHGGAFEDFTVALTASARTSDALPAALGRLTEMAAASICTLADAAPEECRALAQRMRDESLARFKTALARGDAVPVGSRDYFIVAGVDAEIELTPVAITWSIGPGQAATMGAGRRKLDPRDVDD